MERRRDAVTQARRRVSCPCDRGPPAALAAVAVHADGADLRLDVVMLPFVSGADPAALKELAVRRPNSSLRILQISLDVCWAT